MRQSDSVSEELDTENVQCALDFENTMNELETQLYYRHLPPKEVALRVMEAACKFYDADWCGLIQVDLDLGLWKPLWWHNECQEDKTTILTNEFEYGEFAIPVTESSASRPTAPGRRDIPSTFWMRSLIKLSARFSPR